MIQLFAAEKKLRILIPLILIGTPFISNAACQVTLEWDSNDLNLNGFQVFGREEGQGYDYHHFWWQGDYGFNKCTIEDLDEDKTYFFIVRAFTGGGMSSDSNEVRFSYNDKNRVTSGSSCYILSLLR
jgi:hypothetical protein